MKNTKPYYLYKRMVSYLDDNIVTIKFCTMQNYAGLVLNDHIMIDHRYDLLQVFVHEVLHLVYPEWAERKILKTEKWFVENSTWFQKKTLLQIMLTEEI